MNNGVTAGDIIVEVNDQPLGAHFSEEDLLVLLTELPRPITVGFKRSGLILDSEEGESNYEEGEGEGGGSVGSDDDSDEEYNVDIELSPITPVSNLEGVERSKEATAFFESMMRKAALSPNTPNTPTTAELRISQDSPGMFIEQPRILKASPSPSNSSINGGTPPLRTTSTGDVTSSSSFTSLSASNRRSQSSSNTSEKK
jgi:hypothetical protein